MKTVSILSAAAVLGLASLASALVNVIVNYHGLVDDPGVAGEQNLGRYTVHLQAASPIGGFDIDLEGNGIWQIQGGSAFASQDSVLEDAIAGAPQAYLDADTHLLFTSSEIIHPGGSTEPRDEGNLSPPQGGDGLYHGPSTFLRSGPNGLAAQLQ